MRKLSLPSLTKKAVKIFNRYIRLKYCNGNIGTKCVTCNTFKLFEDLEAGHYIKSTYLHVKFDELNVHPQCVRCNRFLDGNESSYALFLTRTYGPDILEVLDAKKNRPQMSSAEKRALCEAVIAIYSEKLKEFDK